MTKNNSKTSVAVNSVIVLMICNMGSKLFGALREAAMSYKYGTSDISDIYFMATSVVAVIVIGVLSALATGYLPVYARAKNESKEAATRFHNAIFTYSILFSLALSLVILIFASPITKLFDPRSEPEQFALTVRMVRIMGLCSVFNCLFQMLTAYLQLKNRFFVAGLGGIVLNICYIIGIFISSESRVTILAYSFVAAHMVTFLLLYAYSKHMKFTLRPALRDSGGYMGDAWRMIYPILLGSLANQLNQVVDRRMASGMETGIISALNYAAKLEGLIVAVFVTSVVTVLFPKLAKNVAAGNMDLVRSEVRSTSLTMSALVVPITFAFIVLSSEIVTLVYMRGAFDDRSVLITSQAFTFYTVGLVATCLREIMNKTLYSMGDTKRPIMINVVGLFINIILNLILVGPLQHMGLALATSISSIVRLIILMVVVHKSLNGVFERTFYIDFGKFVLAAGIMAGAAYFFNGFLDGVFPGGQLWNMLEFVIVALAGALLYFVLLLLFRSKTMLHWLGVGIEYVQKIWSRITGKKGKI